MKTNRESLHNTIYLSGLILLAVSLPVSVFGMSVSQFIIVGNWLAEGQFRDKWKTFSSRKSIWIFLSVFAVHILGLTYTSDYNYAFNDLRIKLPLFLLPVFIGTSKPLTLKQFWLIMHFFLASIFISSLICAYRSITLEAGDYREISVFISHIRYSLMIDIAVFYLVSQILFIRRKRKTSLLLAYIALFFWLVAFLFILKSMTGIVILVIASIILMMVEAFRLKRKSIKAVLVLIALSIPVGLTLYTMNIVDEFYPDKPNTMEGLETYTVNGNLYFHNINQSLVENGNWVWNYFCEEELKREWPKRSQMDFYGKDKNGNILNQTLARYMTSRDLRKDSLGLTMLSDEEIRAVENGIANYRYLEEWSPSTLVYNVVWVIDAYKRCGNPSGHSLTQRIEYLKAAFYIIHNNFWFGVGTGDVQTAFNDAYVKINTSLDKEYQLRAHNQMVTFFLTFGVFGFLIILFAIILPVFIEKKWRDMMFLSIFIIGFLSFLNEDTLETQAGVTFFVFFYCLFVFARLKPESKEDSF